jgi:hypothetical protein
MCASVPHGKRTWTSTEDDSTALAGQERVESRPRPHISASAAPAPEWDEPTFEVRLTDRGRAPEAAVPRRLRGRHRRFRRVAYVVGGRNRPHDRECAQFFFDRVADQPAQYIFERHRVSIGDVGRQKGDRFRSGGHGGRDGQNPAESVERAFRRNSRRIVGAVLMRWFSQRAGSMSPRG